MSPIFIIKRRFFSILLSSEYPFSCSSNYMAVLSRRCSLHKRSVECGCALQSSVSSGWLFWNVFEKEEKLSGTMAKSL